MLGDEVTRINALTDDIFDRGHDGMNRYQNQIGWAQCIPGWINTMKVNDGMSDLNDAGDARQCVIGSVFTQPCLMDPKLNGMDKTRRNEAYAELVEYNVGEDYVKRIKEDCKQFVGLEMQADPKRAALGYFSSAIRAGYQQMMVQEKAVNEHGEPKDFSNRQSFSIYDTQNAKNNYNINTGEIGPCGCNQNVCEADNSIWFFCKT